MKKKIFPCILILFFTVFIVHAQTLNREEAAANDAGRRLNEALLGGTSASTDQGTVQAIRGGTRPGWVNNPSSAYSRDRYLAQVGFASSRIEAERRALAALVSYFGQSIQTDYAVAAVYSEAVSNGIINVSENTHVQELIVTAASMDSLIGAGIGSVWDDERGTIYALAYIELDKLIAIYTEIIRMNQRNIENLITMSSIQKNTFDGYARYKLAALLAGINAEYANIVSLAGGSTAEFNMTPADTLNLETSNIIRNISVGFNISGDQNNRIRDAFAKVFSNEGLRTQGSNTPYMLVVTINMDEAVFPNNNFIFCRYTINANLIERATNAVLLPFSYSDREGHTTYESAQVRALMAMERVIGERYPVLFREYLADLMPQ